MARRKLSTGGRIVAAGVSVGVAAGLVGAMAAGDHSAHASQSVNASSDNAAPDAQPYDPYRDDSGNTAGGTQRVPQSHTRSGGS
jgi:hypothetical protein